MLGDLVNETKENKDVNWKGRGKLLKYDFISGKHKGICWKAIRELSKVAIAYN